VSFPRDDYAALGRYRPDRRPVALDLSDNTNLWGTHPAALARIRSAETDDLARYPELYADVLRDAVAERFGVEPECVTTGAGSDDVLDSAFRAAAGARATVSYAAPTFSMVEPLAAMNGMGAQPVAWADALDDPRRLLEGDPSLVYVCRPNNPTGGLAPRAWVERLVAERKPVAGRVPLVILDEAYADFAEDTLAPWAAGVESVLVARTASKAYGLAGLRCGFGVARPDAALEIDKSRGPYKVARLAAEAVAAAIRDPGGWMRKTVAAAVASRERLRGELEARGLRPLASHANFLLFAAPGGLHRAGAHGGPAEEAGGVGSAGAAALALRERGVAVRPFGAVPGLGEGLRVTVGPWPLMETFLAALDDLLGTEAEAGRREGGAP